MNNKFILQRERDFGDNISSIFTILRTQFKKLIGSIILIAGPIVILLSIVSAYITMRDFNALTDGDIYNDGILDRYLNSIISYGAIWFGNAMVSTVTFSYLKVYKKVSDYSEITTDMVWQETKKHILKVLVASVISIIIIALASLMLVVPGLIMAIFLSMFLPVIVFENESIGSGFNRSFQLISDNFWITLGLAIVVFLIAYFFTMIFSVPTLILTVVWSFNSIDSMSQGEGFSQMSDTFNTMMLIAGLFANLGSMLVSVIPNLSIALHYFNLKEQKESSSLMDQISSMGNAVKEEKETY